MEVKKIVIELCNGQLFGRLLNEEVLRPPCISLIHLPSDACNFLLVPCGAIIGRIIYCCSLWLLGLSDSWGKKVSVTFMIPKPGNNEFLLLKICTRHLNLFLQFNVVDVQYNFQKKVCKDRWFGLENVIIDFIKQRQDAFSNKV